MKKIFLTIAALFSIALFAQEEQVDMTKYMAGVIPMKDGKVVFEKNLSAPTLTQEHVYQTAYSWLEDYLDDFEVENPLIFESKDPQNSWMASLPEHFLVFRKTVLSVDRTFIKYRIRLNIYPEKVHMEIWDISYEYYPGSTKEPERYTAENCITDEYALDKTKTKLNRVTSKFRIKTIDMVDDLAKELELLLNAEVAKNTAAINRAAKSSQPQMISYERHTPTPAAKSSASAAKQPTLAELQSQMAQKKNTPAPAPAQKAETPASAPSANKEVSAPVVPSPAAPASSSVLPADVVSLMKDGGMVISASGRVASAQWGGVAYLDGKTVILCFIPSSKPAHAMLSSAETFTVTVGGAKYHVIECKKTSSVPVNGVTMFMGEVLKVESK